MSSDRRKTGINGFDIITLFREIEPVLREKLVDNVYITKDHIFLFKLNPGGLTLLFEPERRLHLTKFKFKTPAKPPQLCMELRKHIRGCRIRSLRENGLERIFYLDLESRNRKNTLVMELFRRGNLMLLDDEKRITLSSHYAKMRDRQITRREIYKEMLPSGIHPTQAKTSDILNTKEETLMKAALKILPFPPLYIEECLLRAGLKETEQISGIEEEKVKLFLNTAQMVYDEHEKSPLEPMIILGQNNLPIDVVPRPLKKYEKNEKKPYESFNEALDDYFSEVFIKKTTESVEGRLEKEKNRIQRIINQQEQKGAKLNKRIEECVEAGKHIQKNVGTIEELMQKLRSVIESGGKSEPLNGVVEINLKDRKALLEVSGRTLWLKITDSSYKNAGSYFDEAKKLKQKLKGLNESIEKVNKKLLEMEVKIEESHKQKPTLEVKRKREWYEKFRWFRSSEDLLVLAGRDASTNRQLIENYMESNDLILHAEFHGAPFVVIKKEGGEIGENTVKEAAVAAVSYSKAWNEGLVAGDAYSVRPEQLSKKPPSGEYMARGSYMIYGKRNYVKGLKLKLAVGVVVNESVKVIGGPVEAVRKLTDYHVEIVPGEIKSGRLAKMIVEALKAKLPEEVKPKLKALSLDEFQSFIPAGKGSLVR
jgi:predicted ribosome quality control (RQC) complex YloA/Tae2 family protein